MLDPTNNEIKNRILLLLITNITAVRRPLRPLVISFERLYLMIEGAIQIRHRQKHLFVDDGQKMLAGFLRKIHFCLTVIIVLMLIFNHIF